MVLVVGFKVSELSAMKQRENEFEMRMNIQRSYIRLRLVAKKDDKIFNP